MPLPTKVPETQEVFKDLVEGFNCKNYHFGGSEELAWPFPCLSFVVNFVFGIEDPGEARNSIF
jgi:hypothetical protein